jgi:N-acetylmuramoyl-L-alanine amidase
MYRIRSVFGRLGLVMALVCFGTAVAAAPQVTDVRVGVYPAKTRIVLDVSGTVTFRTFILPKPYRVVVDMSEVTWSPKMRKAPHGGLITGMRFGLFKPGSSRVVLDASGPVRVAKAFVIPPPKGKSGYRLVVDIAKTNRKAFMTAYQVAVQRNATRKKVSRPVAGDQRAIKRAALRTPPPLKRKTPKEEKPLIMIDPGHGGVDPGAMSRSGVWEKHIVLAFARELRRQLLQTGKYRVRLTRDGDIFIRLRNRIARARRAGADLFISVHADSIRNHRVRGTSVYTLSERASDKEAGALAQKENKSDLIAGVDLNEQSNDVVNILIDLAQRETMNESAVFARKLVDELARVRKMLRNTHRFAGFAVLKAPDIPSVLVELGYLSNRADERMLRDARQRRRLASAMTRAVNAYFLRQQALNKP